MQLVIECRLCFCPLFYFYYIFSTLRHLSLFDQFYFIKKCSYNYAVGNTQYLNISTTPLWQWGFWQCLPFSWTTLRGKHCRHHIAVLGAVDTFGHRLCLQWLAHQIKLHSDGPVRGVRRAVINEIRYGLKIFRAESR